MPSKRWRHQMPDEPLSYWVALARMGFEDDLNRLLGDLGISEAELARRLPEQDSGEPVSDDLETMVKRARAVGGIVQVRVIKEKGEVMRIVDYETARMLDERQAAIFCPAQQRASKEDENA